MFPKKVYFKMSSKPQAQEMRKKTIPRYIRINLLTPMMKRRILKSARDKKTHLQKGNKVKAGREFLTGNDSSENTVE